MSQEEHFDEEILRHFEPLKRQLTELQAKVAALEGELAAHEKRELLRVRNNQFRPYRVCNSQMQPPDPPISEAEQTFCEANHGAGIQENPTLNLPAFPPAANWDGIEKQAAAVRKARGGG